MKLLTEALQSNNLRDLFSRIKRSGEFKKFGPVLFKFSGGIKLDALTDEHVVKVKGNGVKAALKQSAKNDKAMLFFFKGDEFIGATQGKNQLHVQGGSITTNKKSSSYGRGYKNDKLGQKQGMKDTGRLDTSQWGYRQKSATGEFPTKTKWAVITPTSLRGLIKEADWAYLIDPTASTSKFSTADIRGDRAKQKAGATALMKMRDIAKENIKRYQAIIKSRIGGKDEVDKMVNDAVANFSKLATKAKPVVISQDGEGRDYTRIYVGKSDHPEFKRYSKGYVTVDDMSNTLRNMMTDYSRYVETNKEKQDDLAKASNDSDSRYRDAQSKYADERLGDLATNIKTYSKMLTSIKPIKG